MNKKVRIYSIIISFILFLVSSPVFAVEYTYDELSRLTSVTYDNGERIEYDYDAAGNMLGVNSVLAAKIDSIAITRISSDPLKLNIDVKANIDAELQYQIWAEDAAGWALIKGYDTDSSCTWEPQKTDNEHYRIQVRIKDPTTGIICDTVLKEMTYDELGIVKIDSITTDTEVQGQGKVNNPVNIIANAKGDDLEYQFIIKKGDVVDTQTDYQASNTFTWTPGTKGFFTIIARARKSIETSNSYEYSIPFEVVDTSHAYPELDGAIFDAQSNGTVNITASSSDPKDGWEYAFSIGESMRGPSYMSPYSSVSNVFNWNPSKFGSGVYEVWSYVKDPDSSQYDDAVRKYYTVKNPKESLTIDMTASDISDPGNIKPVDSNPLVSVDNTFEFKATSNPGRDLLYSFWLLDEKGYRIVRDYETPDKGGDTWQWMPVKSGIYTVLVRVKENGVSGSYENEKAITFTVTDGNHTDIQNINIDSVKVNGSEDPGQLKKRTNVKLEVDATGTDSLMYFFAVTDDLFGWRTLRQFSPENTLNWMPKKAGKYQIIVWVKDAVSGSYEKTTYKDVVVGD